MTKYIEYQVNYEDGDVDHVSWREALRLAAYPTPDIHSIERVTNWGNEDEGVMEREFVKIYEKPKHI